MVIAIRSEATAAGGHGKAAAPPTVVGHELDRSLPDLAGHRHPPTREVPISQPNPHVQMNLRVGTRIKSASHSRLQPI